MKDLAPDQMACGLCVEPGRFALEQRAKPMTAPAGSRLVDIAAIGICGTDYHIFEGKHPFLSYPRVIGHELSGHLADGPDAGQLVVVNPYLSCGTCRACQRGKPNCAAPFPCWGCMPTAACAPGSWCRNRTSIPPTG